MSAKPVQKANGVTPARPDKAELVVRPAVPSDEKPLAFFFDTLLRNDYFLRRGQLGEMLRGPHHRVFVAEIAGVLVGVAVTTRGTRLVNALVHPAYRGLGIGKAVAAFTAVTEVRVKRDMSTGDPRGFYAALGFQPTGEHNDKGNIELWRRAGQQPDVAPRVNGNGNGRRTTRK